MPGEVDAHDPVRPGERGQLLVPVVTVPGPAVDEHQRRLTGACDVERDLDAIRCCDAAAIRTGHGIRRGRSARAVSHERTVPLSDVTGSASPTTNWRRRSLHSRGC